jgi:hypothetical protein
MKILSLLILLSLSFKVGAQTTQQDSAHRQYHLMRKKDPKQNNPYAFADSAMAKKASAKPKKKTR